MTVSTQCHNQGENGGIRGGVGPHCPSTTSHPPPLQNTSRVKPVTICYECKWFRGRGEIWFNQYCEHPANEAKRVIDPVTGEEGYGKVNDLGRVVIVDLKHPNARDVNDGNCEHWEE